jgi:hypothetical protein
MTKEEVERLLRHGAYDIFNEEKTGSAEAESNDFVQQDIDSILERRSRTVVHQNTGSQSNAAGGTFSKASFKAPKTPDGTQNGTSEDIDIEDPEFWTKMVGVAPVEAASDLKPRKRNQANYNERLYERRLDQDLTAEGGTPGSQEADSSDYSSADDEDDDDSDADPSEMDKERAKWGGSKPNQWKRDQADGVFKALENYGYGNFSSHEFHARLSQCKMHSDTEVGASCICSLQACNIVSHPRPVCACRLIACAGHSFCWRFARSPKTMRLLQNDGLCGRPKRRPKMTERHHPPTAACWQQRLAQ